MDHYLTIVEYIWKLMCQNDYQEVFLGYNFV